MKSKLFAAAILVLGLSTVPALASIISVAGPVSDRLVAPSIIPAPAQVGNVIVFNDAQQGFNERQGVVLGAALAVDAGFIAAGRRVNSHMIFLNAETGTPGISHLGVQWLFDGVILGVMSDTPGNLEAASNALLGAPGTLYPGAFADRGMEGIDSYLGVGTNLLIVNMQVTQPGDWIRVVTAAPEPGTLSLLGIGLACLMAARRRKS